MKTILNPIHETQPLLWRFTCPWCTTQFTAEPEDCPSIRTIEPGYAYGERPDAVVWTNSPMVEAETCCPRCGGPVSSKWAIYDGSRHDASPTKPPLGARPYWIDIEDRIDHLQRAIKRFIDDGPSVKNQRLIAKWQIEIDRLMTVKHYLDKIPEDGPTDLALIEGLYQEAIDNLKRRMKRNDDSGDAQFGLGDR